MGLRFFLPPFSLALLLLRIRGDNCCKVFRVLNRYNSDFWVKTPYSLLGSYGQTDAHRLLIQTLFLSVKGFVPRNLFPAVGGSAMGLVNRASRLDRWLIVIFFGFIGAFSTFQLHDLDTWFHLKVGELILQRGGIPVSMDFVYSVPSHPWQDGYWLFQVIIASVYRIGGVEGLCLLRTALVATLFALLCQTIRVSRDSTRSQTIPPAGCGVSAAFLIPCLLLASLAASNRFRLRPDLFTLLLVAGCLYLLHAYRAGRERIVWLLPLLQVVWVNSHQLFPLGLFLVGAFLVGEIIEKWVVGKKVWDGRLAVVMLGMGVACFINPYGPKLLWSPLPAYSQVQSNPYFITELFPPFSSALPPTPDLFWYPILMAVSGLSLLLGLIAMAAGQLSFLGLRPPQNAPQAAGDGPGGSGAWDNPGQDAAPPALHPSLLVAHLLIYGGFLYLSLKARRNVALFAVVAAPIAAIHLQEVAGAALGWAKRRGGRSSQATSLLGGMGAVWQVCLLLLLVVLTWQVATDRYYVRNRSMRRFGLGVSPLVYPEKAVDFILSTDLPGNLFNSDEVGHYFTWRAYPRKRSFIDGTFPGGLIGAYLEVMRRPGVAWDTLVQRYDLNYVLLNHASSPTERLLRRLYRDKAWRLIYFDDLSVVFIRDLPRNREIIERFALDLGKIRAANGSEGKEGPDALKAQRTKIEDRNPVGSPGGDGMVEMQPLKADGRRPTLFGGLMKRAYFPTASFNRGNFFFKVADLPERAAEEYEAGLRIYPDDPLAHNNLAAIYHQLGRFGKSVEHYREALRLEPRDAEIHFNLALAYRGQGISEREEAEYRRALELKPDFKQARLQLGLFYLRRGDRARANQELRQVMGNGGFHRHGHPSLPMAE